RPERFEEYIPYGFDLVVCGHTHGGLWRLPGIVEGFFATGQGLFPTYVGGKYEKDGCKMIVSRGLSKKHILIPRIFNRPEVVLVHISSRQ
ncbi:MAG: metallophosphoesterase, partial [Oscillospiraceae bacterium]|nr:metallophosphoesterase [Oscillospiraceae bacterium]